MCSQFFTLYSTQLKMTSTITYKCIIFFFFFFKPNSCVCSAQYKYSSLILQKRYVQSVWMDMTLLVVVMKLPYHQEDCYVSCQMAWTYQLQPVFLKFVHVWQYWHYLFFLILHLNEYVYFADWYRCSMAYWLKIQQSDLFYSWHITANC